MSKEPREFEHTPTWIVAGICSVIVIISLGAARGLHKLGKWLQHKKSDALFEALEKLKEELMLLGFISLLLTVGQGLISRFCIPRHVAANMHPCESVTVEEHSYPIIHGGRRLLTSSNDSKHCTTQGKVPLLSLEALHELHIFIFVLAVVHMIFCATTMVLGGAKIRTWKHWETVATDNTSIPDQNVVHHRRMFFEERKKKIPGFSWVISFFKQFYGSVTKSDYIALRQGFILTHCPANKTFNFHKYMLRTLQSDFRMIVSISWYLWLFLVLFLLLNVGGWHTFFWLSFLPLILLLMVGTKLEHIITELAEEATMGSYVEEHKTVKPSDKYFWFGRPALVLMLIHFILFQNSFEIAFYFWILCTYGPKSCSMEKMYYVIPRLIMGLIVQVLCSYSTLPLYALVAQMGSLFKKQVFDDHIQDLIGNWVHGARSKQGNKDDTDTPTLTAASGSLEIQRTVTAQLPPIATTTELHPCHDTGDGDISHINHDTTHNNVERCSQVGYTHYS